MRMIVLGVMAGVLAVGATIALAGSSDRSRRDLVAAVDKTLAARSERVTVDQTLAWGFGFHTSGRGFMSSPSHRLELTLATKGLGTMHQVFKDAGVDTVVSSSSNG